ncbi:transcriptional regulator [Xanthomonas citri pv. fuscans]|uniref:Transcriptional regulator n=1 Tax=Xanthomonas citri pv. fuscans TaxID=366649 RepID=A0AB34Q5K5_XANCI|nr:MULTISPECIES: transcriptional regulator [Xanthomonas]KGU52057.1 transcriptional regulator [Xanthomonas citri pv. fuscans]MDM4802406.1 transcriptional regulator [Xanthomonas phaseoli pv. phaseoli]MDM4806482.1 transcriptional regulator [Xanthomonas phaseoli pv. phaseoli]MDM4810554.1 transcriptional regulator [Xanthomonas phaseoli pv. phaseoli]
MKDRSHNQAMAEQFRADPAYAAELLAEVRRDDPAELRVLLRQLAAAFGPEWPGFSEDDRNTLSSA